MDINKFLKDGWVIVDVPELKGEQNPLGQIHRWSLTDDGVKEVHIQASKEFWKDEYSLKYAKWLMPFVSYLIGLDVMVQYNPYFRIARPHKPKDNIGFHKDTQYGQTPYELAVHIPFVDLDEKSALRVISGSHLMPESAFTRITADNGHVEKGSIENQIGRPYMPKPLAVPEGMETTPMCIKVGQAAIFSPALFHGQEVNEGDVTRISCDLRFVGSRAPIEIRKGKIHAGYVPVLQSPVEYLADNYYGAQNAN